MCLESDFFLVDQEALLQRMNCVPGQTEGAT